MVTRDLTRYVEARKKEGVRRSVVAGLLRGTGWAEHDVHEVITKVYGRAARWPYVVGAILVVAVAAGVTWRLLPPVPAPVATNLTPDTTSALYLSKQGFSFRYPVTMKQKTFVDRVEVYDGDTLIAELRTGAYPKNQDVAAFLLSESAGLVSQSVLVDGLPGRALAQESQAVLLVALPERWLRVTFYGAASLQALSEAQQQIYTSLKRSS